MLKRAEQCRARRLFVLDLLTYLLALPLAYLARAPLYDWVTHTVASMPNPVLYPLWTYLWMLPIGWAVAGVFALYHPDLRPVYRLSGLSRHLLVSLEQQLLIAFCIGFGSYLFRLDVSRSLVLLFLLFALLLQIITRIIVITLNQQARNGFKRVVVVGAFPQALEIGRELGSFADRGFMVAGYLTDSPPPHPPGAELLGRPEELPQVLDQNVVDQVIFVGSGRQDLARFERLLLICDERGILTRLALNFFPRLISRTSLDHIAGQPFLAFSPVPEQALPLLIKRAMDIVGALVGIVICLPVWLILPILIRLGSRGPAIYRQVRCGMNGRRFVLYKFRSMVDGAEDVLWEIRHLNEMQRPVFKMRNDPRVTPLGRFIRRTSLDELPQFFNVLRGDMSLVGPRAALPEEVREYTPWQRRRLSVKPGITCLWQVSGRNEIDFDDWMRLDLKYIDNWSLWLDIRILFQTIPTVLLCRGAR